MDISALILASGESTRMNIEEKKQFLYLNGLPVLMYSVNKFLAIPEVKEVIVVVSEDDREAVEKLLTEEKVRIITGGKRRQDSSLNGIKAAMYDYVAIHDAARPNFRISTVKKMIKELNNHDCVVPYAGVNDTARYQEETIKTLDRNMIRLIQTPQFFKRDKIKNAIEMIAREDITDDMEAYLKLYDDYKLVKGNRENIKITTTEDFYFISSVLDKDSLRIGFGYDSHNLKEGNGITLGDVKIDCEYSVIAHSDGDVVIHSLIDSLLGATGTGDIGELFPDTEDWTLNMSSTEMLSRVMKHIGYFHVKNVDIVIILDEPKLGEKKKMIKNKIAKYLKIEPDRVSIKAKTAEGRNDGKKIEVYTQILINYFN